MCKEKFTKILQPTLDRIDCKKGHSADNVRPCCAPCNMCRSDRPTTIDNEAVYHLLRNGITGGLSNVMHRVNIAGDTKINHFKISVGDIHTYGGLSFCSKDSDNVMTHVMGVDFNSLYPFAMGSIRRPWIKYDNGTMYMPAALVEYTADPDKATSIFNEIFSTRFAETDTEAKSGLLLIVSLKGHIDSPYLNEFINFPPIFRNINIDTDDAAVVGDITAQQIKKVGVTGGTQRKLTQLLSTHDEYMTFSSYYLYFLIDRCHCIVDENAEIVTFTKTDCFKKFVTTFMNRRIAAMKLGNKGYEKYCKMMMNSSYGFDILNEEKYTKTKLCDYAETKDSQRRPNFISARRINNDLYLVTYRSTHYKCNTCIQLGLFTLDNAKYAYCAFAYDFLYRCLDMSKIHFIEGDTDSSYLAIAGNPDHDIHQGFRYVVADRGFYHKHYYEWFPDPYYGKENEKKLGGFKAARKVAIDAEHMKFRMGVKAYRAEKEAEKEERRLKQELREKELAAEAEAERAKEAEVEKEAEFEREKAMMREKEAEAEAEKEALKEAGMQKEAEKEREVGRSRDLERRIERIEKEREEMREDRKQMEKDREDMRQALRDVQWRNDEETLRQIEALKRRHAEELRQLEQRLRESTDKKVEELAAKVDPEVKKAKEEAAVEEEVAAIKKNEHKIEHRRSRDAANNG
ncbi:hypothetical protein FACS189472_11380 [Alphaproteobacteria bacterium]|nr:hypothetical protein FACS189472_11380 [Alphaproteobacteria bacterium]